MKTARETKKTDGTLIPVEIGNFHFEVNVTDFRGESRMSSGCLLARNNASILTCSLISSLYDDTMESWFSNP